MSGDARSHNVYAVWPLLLVEDIVRSITFYRDQLGFQLVGEAKTRGDVYWCRLERGGASLMLQQAKPEDGLAKVRGQGVALYFVCEDVDSIYAELLQAGLEMRPPRVADYGMKQLYVPEPDGYSICFESSVAADV